jgi:hypothetical protein
MRRREFIAFLGGTTAAWPQVAPLDEAIAHRMSGYVSAISGLDRKIPMDKHLMVYGKG